MRWILISLFLPLTFNLNAQKIQGYIIDAKTEKPIPYANVYFANTTIGTATDENGFFQLSNFKASKYELTVSFVGYHIYSESIDINSGELMSFNILLKEKLVELPEMFVLADTSNWADNFAVFRQYFIGTTEANVHCVIKNKKSLVFYYDQDTKILYGHAREPLIIENSWLGYEIIYDLQSFKFNFKEARLAYFGVPRFKSLITEKKSKKKKWGKRRRSCYNGSILHFMRSLYQRKVKDNGFDIYEMHKISNPERPSETFLNKTLARINEKIKVKYGNKRLSIKSFESKPKTLEDSLLFFTRLKKLPLYKDSVGRNFNNGDDLISQSGKVHFSGRLMVIYKDNVPKNYPWKRNRTYDEKQKTTFQILSPIKVYKNGYYENVKDTFVQGYWSWTGNLATLLPLDYYPENKNK